VATKVATRLQTMLDARFRMPDRKMRLRIKYFLSSIEHPVSGILSNRKATSAKVHNPLLRHGESQASHQRQAVVFRFDTIELTFFEFKKTI